MPGARLGSFRLGDRAELLVEHLLAGVAFTTRVPRQEDIGIDFMCSLIKGSHGSGLLKAGPFFSVQAKSPGEVPVYDKTHELEWITHQENPLLVCVADREQSAMDVYSTWNLTCAVQGGWGSGEKPANRIRLCPGEIAESWPGLRNNSDGSQDVLLGRPIIRITHDQVFDADKTAEIAEVLEGWVAIDRENIVNRGAGLNWVVGPLTYETGKPLSGAHGGFFYWHPDNLQKCFVNLGRSAVAVWNILNGQPQVAALEPWKTGVPPLRPLLMWLRSVDSNLSHFVRGLDD